MLAVRVPVELWASLVEQSGPRRRCCTHVVRAVASPASSCAPFSAMRPRSSTTQRITRRRSRVKQELIFAHLGLI
jgi:hypothetical protein